MLEQPQWSALHKDWEPCPVCREIIDNVFEDTPDEDQLSFEHIEEEIVEEIQEVENSS